MKKSLSADYKEMTKDQDVIVIIQGLVQCLYPKTDHVEELLKIHLASNSSKGPQLVGVTQILEKMEEVKKMQLQIWSQLSWHCFKG
jgi:hypothetical protein